MAFCWQIKELWFVSGSFLKMAEVHLWQDHGNKKKKIELLGKRRLQLSLLTWWREKQVNPSVGNNYFELPSMDSLGNFVTPFISVKIKPFHTYLKI